MKLYYKIAALLLMSLIHLSGFGQSSVRNLSHTKVGDHSYSTAIGLRAGLSSGISIKHFVNNNRALEGILHFYGHGIGLTGLYEVHKTAFGSDRASWFYGLGAHVGTYSGGHYKDRGGVLYRERYTNLGVDGIFGLEYHFIEIPFTLGVDIKPFVDIINPGGQYIDLGLTFRYAF